ncbi:MAG TPA: adenylate/guanylate cyclase domain-containing protein [Anaerolineales bacterium]|nr:adenylate/guanylate cyclase domain-containing protein [Anaerolineales bacterium]
MTNDSERSAMVEELWRKYLTTGEFEKERRQRHFLGLLPGAPRCKNCLAPFKGAGSPLVRFVYGKRPSNLNPQLCNVCEEFAHQFQGGAEIELSLLFADVRGSTPLAERMSPKDFGRLINRFYNAATQVMIKTDAFIDKITGDQVAAMYVPGFAGPQHARRAVEAAQMILRATGHDRPEGPWIPLGVGVHTGTAFVGSVGSEEGTSDITVLGDPANTAARLSSSARQGEILISDAAYIAAGLSLEGLETRYLELKGKSERVMVHVLTELTELQTV